MSELKYGVWNPIETAPKDGTAILLYCSNFSRKEWVGKYYKHKTLSHGEVVSEHEGWLTGSTTLGLSNNPKPTHWMPLPLPPTYTTQPD